MTLSDFNKLNAGQAEKELFKCCGSNNWVKTMVKLRPFQSQDELKKMAADIWMNCEKDDYLEAFSHHPRIGDLKTLKAKFGTTRDWASQEQGGVATAEEKTLEELAGANNQYLEKFGYIFIVCATGKSAGEMLGILGKRLNNDPDQELQIAIGEQLKITLIRLNKLLS